MSITTPTVNLGPLTKCDDGASKTPSKRRFFERTDLLTGPDEYVRSGHDPGLVLIFNQEHFEEYSTRLGSRRDVNEIVDCFGRLGFNISDEMVFVDLKRAEILNVIEKVSKMDLTHTNCLIVFFLTHGDAYNTLHAFDLSLRADELWSKFSACPNLKNKPKLFIIQACKGQDYSKPEYSDQEPVCLVPTSMDGATFHFTHLGADMLVVYSATEGNVSFRNTITGSWFIQELCRNFSTYGRRDDVISLIIRTTKYVTRHYYHCDAIYEANNGNCTIRKQMPIFVSTLRRKFYLNRNRERHILLDLEGKYEQLAVDVQDLHDGIEEAIKKLHE